MSDPPGAASLLVRALAGLARARGRMRLAGLADPSADGWGRRVAYLGPEPGIRSWMTPREALLVAGDLLGLSHAEAARRTDRALAWVGIEDDAAHRTLRRGGTALAQRTGLAAALIGDPEVLLLDDPLRAVDAAERTRMLRLPGRRRTLVLASRRPTAEAGLADHVALIRGGRIALFAPVADLAAAGHELSMAGIVALADGQGRDPEPPPVAVAGAVGPR